MTIRGWIRGVAGMLQRPKPASRRPLAEPLDPSVQVPRHLVIIPDGNRRWADAHGLSKTEGHRRGAEVVEELIWQCRDWGVAVLTIWGFSTQNWNRPKKEVSYLMDLMAEFLERNVSDLEENQVRFRHLGRRDRIPERLRRAIERAEERTSQYSAYRFNLCLDYGGRDEIVRAIGRIIDTGMRREELTEETFSEFLDTHGLPDPDLMLRTSGERRLSGILPYQSESTELAFVDEHFPDLNGDILRRVFEDYSRRERRYGE